MYSAIKYNKVRRSIETSSVVALKVWEGQIGLHLTIKKQFLSQH